MKNVRKLLLHFVLIHFQFFFFIFHLNYSHLLYIKMIFRCPWLNVDKVIPLIQGPNFHWECGGHVRLTFQNPIFVS